MYNYNVSNYTYTGTCIWYSVSINYQLLVKLRLIQLVFFTVKQLPPVGFFFSLLNLDKNLKIQIHLIN